MYSKMKASGSESKSEDSERDFHLDREEEESESDPKTLSEYDSPTSEIKSQTESYMSENPSKKKKVQINKSNLNAKHSNSQSAKQRPSEAGSHIKQRSNEKKKTKNKGCITSYSYETIIGIHLYRTSALKFKKYIRAPRVKVSIYDVKNCSLVAKSDVNRNVIINMEPDNVDYILPIMSREGRLSDDRSFSFTFDECLIVNEDIEQIRNENIIIFFEILDTVVINFKTRLKMKNSDGWHYISWAFFKPNSIEDTLFNKNQILQLYKYRKSKRSASIIEHWSDSNRKKYPGTLEVAVKDVKYKQDEIEQSRPHTALQKDKHISKLPTGKQNDIRDDEGNFIIAGTSDGGGGGNDDGLGGSGLVASGRHADILRSKVEKMLPLIKLRNLFHLPNKFQCPVQELKCKQLARRCLLCCFNESGSLLAYTDGRVDEKGMEEVRDNKFATINIVIAQVPSLVQQYILKGHTNRIHCLRWMPAIMSDKLTVGKQVLLSTSEDHTCILWFLGTRGSYSLEVLPHPCALYSAEFLLAENGSTHQNKFKTAVSISTGGSDTILYIWRMDTISKKAKSKKCQTPTAKTSATQRRQHEVHLQQEILKHDSHIVDMRYSRSSGNLYSGDVGGTVLEWKSLEKDARSGGRGRGKILWTNTRSFRVTNGLERLQIVDRAPNQSSILFASTVTKPATSQGDAVASVHKINMKTGHRSEILTRTLSAALINSMTFNFAVVTSQSSPISPSFALFTSDANRITYLNLKSDIEIETIAINATTTGASTRTQMSAPMSKDEFPFGCIQALDITTNSTTDCEKNILAIALSSSKQLEENYIFLYGPRNAKDNNVMDDSTKSSQDADSSRTSGSLSPTSPDGKNISRLTTFFNDVLNKCDRIIRYGSANNSTSGYKLANAEDGHSAMDVDVNDDVDSDGASIRSDKTFTIENISEESDDDSGNRFGNTFSIDQVNDENSQASGGTFTIEKPAKSRKNKSRKDDTDISEDLESNN